MHALKEVKLSDQSLVDVFVMTAVKAASTLATKGSASLVIEYLGKIDVGNRLLWGLGDWSKLKLTRHQHKKLVKYLNGRSCNSLLELLAIAEYSSVDDEQRKSGRQQLRAAFCLDAQKATRSKGDDAEVYLNSLWSDLERAVSSYVSEMKRSHYLRPNDVAYHTALTDYMRTRPKADQGSIFASRLELASQHERVVKASEASAVIRSALKRRFERMWIPHVRNEYRLALNDIYVDRWLEILRKVLQRHDWV